MNYRFLAICDNQTLAELLQTCVKQGGYAIDIVKTGSLGFKAVMEARPDLLILDIGMPDISGLSWLGILRQMKEGMDLPVIVTGENIGHDEMAAAFDLGADDCISFRHCDPRELSARIRATLRRRGERSEHAAARLVIGPVDLDSSRHRCFVGGKEVELRAREFELLEILMRKAGRVLSRPYLLESVWGMSSSANTRAVDVTVSRLRRALGGKAAAWIDSVAKFGYRFSDPDDVAR